MNNEKCRFHSGKDYCRILLVESCDGMNENCSFYKTEQQFRESADRAILINRRKCRCEGCTYTTKPCQLSSFYKKTTTETAD